MMLALIQTFLLIALRRLGPEDLPASGFLLGLVAVAYVAMQLPLALPVYGAGPVLARALLIDVALLVGFAWGLLSLTGHPRRLRQTLTALFGTGALFSLFMLPVNAALTAFSTPQQPALLPTAALLVLLVWSLIVNGHIYARALSTRFALGLAASIAHFILNFLAVSQGPGSA